VTVVTSDGSVITTNEKDYPDLFFGIRGGGSNFGVVTEFVYKLHPQRPTVYAGMLIYPPTALDKIVSVTAEWWATADENPKQALVQVMSVGPDGNVSSPKRNGKQLLLFITLLQPAVVLIAFYNGTEAEGRAKFKPFLDIGMCLLIANCFRSILYFCQGPSWIQRKKYHTRSSTRYRYT